MDFSHEATLENLKYTIEMMEKLHAQKAKLDMRIFQHTQLHLPLKTELKEAVDCGTACCLAGYIAVSPRWKEQGGEVGMEGCPAYYPKELKKGRRGIYLAGKWLGLADDDEIEGLFANNEQSSIQYYGWYREDITYPMVINKLKAILARRQQGETP